MVAIAHPALPQRRIRPAVVAARQRRLPAATYRRRRLVLFGVVLVLLALAPAALQLLGGTGAAPAPRPVASVAVVVQPGDTVWSIASELAPGDDPRPVVDAIVAANGGAALVAGQRLDVRLP